MNLFELSAKISVDDTNFKKSMENAQKVSKNVATAIKNLQSPLDKAKSGFNAIAHPVETAKANIEKLKNATESIRHPIETFKNKVAEASTALETKRNKLSTLAAGYDSAKKKVDDLTKEFNKSAKESGTSSQKTQELAKKLNEAENEAEEAKKELDDYSASVSKAGKNSDSASKGVGNFASKLGKGIATAGKIGVAAVGAAAAGITALTTAAANNYAEYEQLVGGAELLFGDAFDFVQEKASEAYKNVQMSQNEYLQQVNGFATGLKTALGGNEQAAAELADRIITAEADIVAATGNSQEAVQNAFNGIMKSNYTMLDNLQLGITPTKEGFQEVIDIVNKWNTEQGKATDYQIDNLADAQSALLDYIEMQGLSGYASMEAANTISGSVASMKSAWENLLTGLADGNADIGQLVDNLVTTIVGDGTEGNLGVIGNILPAVETALNGAGKLIDKALPIIIDKIPEFIEKYLPKILESGVSIILQLALGLIKAIPSLIKTIPEIISSVVSAFKSKSGEFSSIGKNIIDGIKRGIQNAWYNLKNWFKNLFGDLIGIAKNILGIASPSKVFKKIGGFTAEGFGAGFDDEFAHVKDDMEDALNFDDASVGINASIRKVGAGTAGGAFGGTSIGNININIDGAKYTDEQSLASAIALELQNMTDRRAAVYA